jgi:hypothetical protein
MRSNVENAAAKLKSYLGPWGFQTSSMTFDDIAYLSKRAFNVPGKTILEIAFAVERLSKEERGARVREAVREHWPDPIAFLPATAPVRKKLAQDRF